jgi:hypothetical protein
LWLSAANAARSALSCMFIWDAALVFVIVWRLTVFSSTANKMRGSEFE